MILSVGNWTIQKAGDAAKDSPYIPVRMVANRLITDRDNEEILPEAFNKGTVENFVKNGIIDWHHQSVLGKSQADKAQAILGRPSNFEWEDGLPVVYANLTKSHPIVRDAILPHLEADNAVFGSSVGGNVRKARRVWDSASNSVKRQISEIAWDHLAIAGRPYVICPGTEVRMIKAAEPSIWVAFSDVGTFENDYNVTTRETELIKALTVGVGTDSASYTGVDAMRKQSLEGDLKKLNEKDKKKKKREDDTKLLMAKLIGNVNKGIIAPTREGLQLFLKAEGYSEADAGVFAEEFLHGLTALITTFKE